MNAQEVTRFFRIKLGAPDTGVIYPDEPRIDPTVRMAINRLELLLTKHKADLNPTFVFREETRSGKVSGSFLYSGEVRKKKLWVREEGDENGETVSTSGAVGLIYSHVTTAEYTEEELVCVYNPETYVIDAILEGHQITRIYKNLPS